MEFLALSINFIGGWTSAFSVIVLKVAPASVFIDSFNETAGPARSERSGLGVVCHQLLEVLGDLSDVGDGDCRESTRNDQFHVFFFFL
jgi:hypothetical protein